MPLNEKNVIEIFNESKKIILKQIKDREMSNIPAIKMLYDALTSHKLDSKKPKEKYYENLTELKTIASLIKRITPSINGLCGSLNSFLSDLSDYKKNMKTIQEIENDFNYLDSNLFEIDLVKSTYDLLSELQIKKEDTEKEKAKKEKAKKNALENLHSHLKKLCKKVNKFDDDITDLNTKLANIKKDIATEIKNQADKNTPDKEYKNVTADVQMLIKRLEKWHTLLLNFERAITSPITKKLFAELNTKNYDKIEKSFNAFRAELKQSIVDINYAFEKSIPQDFKDIKSFYRNYALAQFKLFMKELSDIGKISNELETYHDELRHPGRGRYPEGKRGAVLAFIKKTFMYFHKNIYKKSEQYTKREHYYNDPYFVYVNNVDNTIAELGDQSYNDYSLKYYEKNGNPKEIEPGHLTKDLANKLKAVLEKGQATVKNINYKMKSLYKSLPKE